MKAVSAVRSYAVTAPLIILSTVAYGSVAMAVSMIDKDSNRQTRVARAWARALLAVSGIKVKVNGLENIKPGGSYVLVSNHLSYMDTPAILGYIPLEFRFLAKKGLFSIPFLGTHLKRAGHVPVVRDDPRGAIRTLTDAATILRERGTSLIIFPEGGRSHDGVLQPFKEGAAYIAIKAGVPIVPVSLKGTREALPYGSATVNSVNVTVSIGVPIETASLKLKDRDRLTEELHERVAAGLASQTAAAV